jgi:hypothetical protein
VISAASVPCLDVCSITYETLFCFSLSVCYQSSYPPSLDKSLVILLLN